MNDDPSSLGQRKPIGEAIHAELARRSALPSWLADRAGLDRSTVTRIIKGERHPSKDTLHLLATALGVNLPDLVAGTDAEEPAGELSPWVARSDHNDAVRRLLEYETQNNDLNVTVRSLRETLAHERERNRQLRADGEKYQSAAAELREALEQARRDVELGRREAARYRDGLERAVAHVAQLQQQIGELNKAVESGNCIGKIGMTLAGVAAVASIFNYLRNDDEAPAPSGKSKRSTKSSRTKEDR